MNPKTMMKIIAFILFLFMNSLPIAVAADMIHEFDNPAQEIAYRELLAELRCLQCENQNLADSQAMVSTDVKQKIYEQIKAGKTNEYIREYMISRYGDYISYKPPLRPSTYVLWVLPPLLLVMLIVIVVMRFYRRFKNRSLNNSVYDEHENMPVDTLSNDEKKHLEQILSKYDTVEERK